MGHEGSADSALRHLLEHLHHVGVDRDGVRPPLAQLLRVLVGQHNTRRLPVQRNGNIHRHAVRWLEMREHHWESIKNISSKSGKLRRALLQFTPESLAPTRWLDPGCSWMRFVAIFQLVLIFQVVELNTFFVKHIFPMPAEHPICVFRILINGLMGAPAARQYYTYVTDRSCKRLGSQVWVFIFISLSELVLNIKFGLDLFSQTQMSKILLWLMLNVLIAVAGTYVSMRIYNWRFPPPPQTPNTEPKALQGTEGPINSGNRQKVD